MKKLFLVSIFIIFTFNTLSADDRMRIAILDFQADGVSKSIARRISELIRTEMINTGKYIVIERNQMNIILKEQGLQQTGCTDENCAVQVGKLLSAKTLQKRLPNWSLVKVTRQWHQLKATPNCAPSIVISVWDLATAKSWRLIHAMQGPLIYLLLLTT